MNKEEIKDVLCTFESGKKIGKKLLDKEPKLSGQKISIIIGITEQQYYEYERLQQENKQLKDNWNKLKEKIEEIDDFQRELKGIPNTRMTSYDAILEIMQELEKGEENE